MNKEFNNDAEGKNLEYTFIDMSSQQFNYSDENSSDEEDAYIRDFQSLKISNKNITNKTNQLSNISEDLDSSEKYKSSLNIIPSKSQIIPIMENLKKIFNLSTSKENSKNWNEFINMQNFGFFRDSRKQMVSDELEDSWKLQIIDNILIIKAFFSKEINSLISEDWNAFLQFCREIPTADFLAFICIEFSEIMETKNIDLSITKELILKLMDSIDTSKETINLKNSEKSSFIWMIVLGIQALLINYDYCFKSKVNSRNIKLNQNSKSSENNSLNFVNSLNDKTKDLSVEEFYISYLQTHKNYIKLYESICSGIVSHSDDSLIEYQRIQFRFLGLIFSNQTLSSQVFFQSDIECIMISLIEALRSFAESESNQFQFDEVCAAIISIVGSDAYKKIYNQSLLSQLKKTIDEIEENGSNECCENAIENCYFLRKSLPED